MRHEVNNAVAFYEVNISSVPKCLMAMFNMILNTENFYCSYKNPDSETKLNRIHFVIVLTLKYLRSEWSWSDSYVKNV